MGVPLEWKAFYVFGVLRHASPTQTSVLPI